MYTEQLFLSKKAILLIALPFAFTIVVLVGVLALVPIPLAGRIPIYGVMVLEAVIGVLLLSSLSRVRIAVDDRALTIAFRMIFKSRIALERIVTCAPSDWRGWGISYSLRGRQYRSASGVKRAVRLTLTNKAEVLFSTRHPDAVCEALHHRRPQIMRG